MCLFIDNDGRLVVTKTGTYIVVLRSHQAKTIQIGKLAPFDIKKGYYLYIGSAFGSGGVIARLKHHAKVSKRPHWHLDYLRAETNFYAAYAEYSSKKEECNWASILAGMALSTEPLKGFGSSDCDCRTHLFYFSSQLKVLKAVREITSSRKINNNLLV